MRVVRVFLLLLSALLLCLAILKALELIFPPVVQAENWDPDLNGDNWYLTGWHLENASGYIKEFTVYDGRDVFHGLIEDCRGDTIYSVSIMQGYLPQRWGVPYWNGTHTGRNRLKVEGYPVKLKVVFMVVNYTFNVDPKDTYCGFCWVTVGVDIRGSVVDKDYNAKPDEGGDSWVFCANLFYIRLDEGGIHYSKEGDVLLRVRDLDYGYGVERLYHYSVAVNNSEDMGLNNWVTLNISLTEYIQAMESAFDEPFKVNRTHLIQPFIETCGGSIEAYFDYVALSE